MRNGWHIGRHTGLNGATISPSGPSDLKHDDPADRPVIMEMVFTEHARGRMAARGLTPLMVESALRWPDEVVHRGDGSSVARKALDGRELRVVHRIEGERCLVVTACLAEREMRGVRR